MIDSMLVDLIFFELAPCIAYPLRFVDHIILGIGPSKVVIFLLISILVFHVVVILFHIPILTLLLHLLID